MMLNIQQLSNNFASIRFGVDSKSVYANADSLSRQLVHARQLATPGRR